MPTDVGDPAATDALLAAAVAAYGRVDAVVHSAAALTYGRFEEVPVEVFEGAVSTTLLGTANVARSSLTQFHRQGHGSLVVVGSLLGKIATPYMSSYVTAKWGVHGLVRCLQVEARSTPGIEVSLVSPGGVDTPVYDQAGTYVGVHGRPPPPIVGPEKVARAVVRCLDHPRRDVNVSVGPANAVTVLGFRLVPGLFDLLVTPLMRAGGLQRRSAAATSGNVLEPRAGRRGGPRAVGTCPDRAEGRGCGGRRGCRRGRRRRPGRPRSGRARSTPMTDRLPPTVSVVRRHTSAPPSAVWEVLADGWLYAGWVVGASRVRAVDAGWPARQARIHHSFGVWPAVIDDESVVVDSRPGELLVIRPKGWPAGEALVEVRLEPSADGGCDLGMREDAVTGPGLVVPRALRQPLIVVRNREALRRLALIAEGRQDRRVRGS